MIKTVLIDDETDSIRVLGKLLQTACPDVKILGSATGVKSGIQLIQETNPDLLFLDIEITQGNAFDLLNQLPTVDFQVIFVTAFSNYAIKAFKYSAVDYLLKPVDIDDLKNAVNKAAERISTKNFGEQMKSLLRSMENLQFLQQKMAVPTINGLEFINLEQISRLSAEGSYTQIYLSNGERLLATRNIKDYEELLPTGFFCRIHNSHIINLKKVQKYQKGRGGYVILEDGSSVEVASRRREEFLARFVK